MTRKGAHYLGFGLLAFAALNLGVLYVSLLAMVPLEDQQKGALFMGAFASAFAGVGAFINAPDEDSKS